MDVLIDELFAKSNCGAAKINVGNILDP